MFSQLSATNFKLNLTPRSFKLVNFFTFQIVWGLSVFGRDNLVVASAILLAVHFYLSPSKKQDMLTVLLVGVCGVALDAMLSFTNIFLFERQVLMPVWLVMLWIAFALTLNHSMLWLTKLNPLVQAGLGGAGGGFSYWMGYNLGAVAFPYPVITTCIILFIAWSLVLPLFCFLVKRYAL